MRRRKWGHWGGARPNPRCVSGKSDTAQWQLAKRYTPSSGGVRMKWSKTTLLAGERCGEGKQKGKRRSGVLITETVTGGERQTNRHFRPNRTSIASSSSPTLFINSYPSPAARTQRVCSEAVSTRFFWVILHIPANAGGPVPTHNGPQPPAFFLTTSDYHPCSGVSVLAQSLRL